MAAAEISRPSWPYWPARDSGDRALPGRVQTDRGPAHEIIGEMDTWTYITAAYFLVWSGLILLGL